MLSSVDDLEFLSTEDSFEMLNAISTYIIHIFYIAISIVVHKVWLCRFYPHMALLLSTLFTDVDLFSRPFAVFNTVTRIHLVDLIDQT